MRLRHKEQLSASYLVTLNEAIQELLHQREMGREVEVRMAAWRQQRAEEVSACEVQEVS